MMQAKKCNYKHVVKSAQVGVALAMLLWFLAALSILVAGIVSTSRTDVRMVQLQLSKAKARAVGDGVTLLAMKDLLLLQQSGEYTGRGVFKKKYRFGDIKAQLHVMPSAGLVSLNHASVELLGKLFEMSGALDQKKAIELAEHIITWRSPKLIEDRPAQAESETTIRYGRFEVIEDLLQVQGVNRLIYEQVSQFVAAPLTFQQVIDPLSAPVELLAVMMGDQSAAEAFIDKRASSPYRDNGITADFLSEYFGEGTSFLFRVDADIFMVDGKLYRRRSWIKLEGKGVNHLPWQVMRKEAVRAVKREVKES